MSYNTIAASAQDQALLQRIAACAAQEGVTTDPTSWALNHAWEVVTATDIEAAYASALANLNGAPGRDPSVITDGMILANVQRILTDEEVTP